MRPREDGADLTLGGFGLLPASVAAAVPAPPESAAPPAPLAAPVPLVPPAPVEAAAVLPLRFGPNVLGVLRLLHLGDREVDLLRKAVEADRGLEKLANFRPPSASTLMRRLAKQEQRRERRPR